METKYREGEMEPETKSLSLKVAPDRLKERYEDATGIYIRAKADEKWGSYDIAQLDKDSLLLFLRSRGGDNPWAEDCIGIMLGHGHLHLTKEEEDESR